MMNLNRLSEKAVSLILVGTSTPHRRINFRVPPNRTPGPMAPSPEVSTILIACAVLARTMDSALRVPLLGIRLGGQ